MPKQKLDEAFVASGIDHFMTDVIGQSLSVLRREFSRFEDPNVRKAAAKVEGQLNAMSELLRALAGEPQARTMAADLYLERLGRALSGAILGPKNVRLELSLEPARLPVEVCERLGQIVVELVVQASRYAFLDQRGGEVRVALFRSDRSWRLLVSDDGPTGARLDRGGEPGVVDALVRSLNGRLSNWSDIAGGCVLIDLPDHGSAMRMVAEPDIAMGAGEPELRRQPVH